MHALVSARARRGWNLPYSGEKVVAKWDMTRLEAALVHWHVGGGGDLLGW